LLQNVKNPRGDSTPLIVPGGRPRDIAFSGLTDAIPSTGIVALLTKKAKNGQLSK
jgi:hypothetical protein